jgi:L-lysine exporter family protein LysE/ArgO
MSWGICSDRHDQIDIGETGDTPPVWSNYLKGFALTLFNPYTVVFWLSVSTYIQTAHLWPTWTVLGLFGAILSWITFMPLLIYRTKHLLSQKTVAAISIVSAGVIAFFGVLLLLRTLWEFYGFFR